jgi:hypothetical protein
LQWYCLISTDSPDHHQEAKQNVAVELGKI